MLTWNDLLDIEMRNRGNADVERLLGALREQLGDMEKKVAEADHRCDTCPDRRE